MISCNYYIVYCQICFKLFFQNIIAILVFYYSVSVTRCYKMFRITHSYNTLIKKKRILMFKYFRKLLYTCGCFTICLRIEFMETKLQWVFDGG